MAERKSQTGEPSTQSGMKVNEGDQNVTQDAKFVINLEELSKGTRIIGKGNHSIVYNGKYKSMDVAVKVIEPKEEASSAFPKNYKDVFKREVMILSKVEHDNLVKFIGASGEPDMVIVMELIGGGSLASYLQKMRPRCPDMEQSIKFAIDISRAMEFLHSKNITHRDLKPASLLLTEDSMKLKLAGFGQARVIDEEWLTADAGTLRWMAPEILEVLCSTDPVKRGQKIQYDRKVDIYSFAIVLWELLTNCTPFEKMTDTQIANDVAFENVRPSLDKIPKDLVPLLKSCWARDPALRPEFTEITTNLSDYLSNNPGLSQAEQPQQEDTMTEQQQSLGQEADSPGTRPQNTNESVEAEDMRMSPSTKRKSKSPKFPSCCGWKR